MIMIWLWYALLGCWKRSRIGRNDNVWYTGTGFCLGKWPGWQIRKVNRQSSLGLLSWCPLALVESLQLIWRKGTRRWNLLEDQDWSPPAGCREDMDYLDYPSRAGRKILRTKWSNAMHSDGLRLYVAKWSVVMILKWNYINIHVYVGLAIVYLLT